MTGELEEQFFKVFGIKARAKSKEVRDGLIECGLYYPEITAEILLKLLKLLCIYNDMQGCIDYCIVPCKYEDVKEMILQTLISEKLSMTDYEKGTYMDVMTKQIQQLFKEKEDENCNSNSINNCNGSNSDYNSVFEQKTR